MLPLIDADGFRPNIGIILANHDNRLFWAKRVGQEAWQFPQGGMSGSEIPEQTLFRELSEEIGLKESEVTVLGRTRHWLRYRIPKRMIRDTQPVCIGQKQLWYLLRLEVPESHIKLDATVKPEFDNWQWVSYWFPLRQVVSFKREVYRRALRELSQTLFLNVSSRGPRSALDHLLKG